MERGNVARLFALLLLLLLLRKVTPYMSTVLVLPGCGVLHDCIAKSTPTMAKSAAIAGRVLWVSTKANSLLGYTSLTTTLG